MRRSVVHGSALLLACACAGAPPAPPPQEATAARVLEPPAPPAPALPDPPGMIATPASAKADRLLPGFCRQRRVENFGTPDSDARISRARYDGERLKEIEITDSRGEFLARAEPKLDGSGRVLELVERDTARKVLATWTFSRDAEGRLLSEKLTRAGEKKPSFERTITRDETGKPVSETWSWGTVAWKLAPQLDGDQVRELVRDDGEVVVRYLRDAAGNVLLESRRVPGPAGEPDRQVRLMNDHGCFGIDEGPVQRLSDLCKKEVQACVTLVKILSDEAQGLGLPRDPALADAYRVHACRGGHVATCAYLAREDDDEERAAGFRHHGLTLAKAACQSGDADSCQMACELGDGETCRKIAIDE